MPSGLFRKEGDRMVFNGQTPEAFNNYHRDHAELLVRYMFLLTPDEQRRLTSSAPPATGGASPAPTNKETTPPAAHARSTQRRGEGLNSHASRKAAAARTFKVRAPFGRVATARRS
jgi:hypothetical protein